MSERNFSFAIFFSLLGIGGGFGLVVAGLLTAPQVLRLLYQPSAFALFLGGMLSIFCTAFSLEKSKQAFGLLWDILSGGSDPDCEGLLKECVMLATRGRESQGQEQKLYREIKPYLVHQILRSGIDLLIAGHVPDMIQATLETRKKQEMHKYLVADQVFQTLNRSAWILGLAAGVLGLLRTNYLQNQSTLPIYLGGIAVPIILGLLLSALVFYPILRQIRLHRTEWENYLDMGIAGVLLLQARHHSLYMEVVLKAYLPLDLPSTVVLKPVSKKPVPQAFQQALAQVEEVSIEEDPSESEDDQPLSVDQLRRFRPVHRRKPEP